MQEIASFAVAEQQHYAHFIRVFALFIFTFLENAGELKIPPS
jgi:hypothetical protein